MKVLITDDSLLAGHAIKSYFRKMAGGNDVIGIAKTGEIAKEMVDKNNPDLVTIDYVMPGMSGVDLAKYINEQDKSSGHRTRILMISSDEIPVNEKSKIKVDAYILKPITLAKIKAAIKAF